MKQSRRWRRICRRQLASLTGPWRKVRRKVATVTDVIEAKCK